MKKLKINAKRVCYGLSKIGYSAASAICDITDNSVSYGAQNCWIQINKIEEAYPDTKKGNIKEYLIIDDGIGMNENKILEALDLGSDDSNYEDMTLSKFGLGMKSASFSQGKRLEVISSDGQNPFVKAVVDLDLIEDEYFCQLEELSGEDVKLVQEFCKEGHGTIIRISKINNDIHPSISKIKDKLTKSNKNLGVIYYYYILDGLSIYLQGDKIEAFDVLFEDEANINGNLNESTWNGKEVRWIEREKEIIVSPENDMSIKMAVVQLVYPPIFEIDEKGLREKTRLKYNIGAGNYGFYIYRNKRLISWANGLEGIIAQDTSLYGFRGRILINSDADEFFNIDVKKENIELGEEVYNQIDEYADRYKRKSRKAWENASARLKEITGEEPTSLSNEIIAENGLEEELSCEDISSKEQEIEKSKRDNEVKEEHKKKIKNETIERIKEEKGKVFDDEITEEDIKDTVKGEGASENSKIFKVPMLEDNVLFEPYYDAEEGPSVRINKSHRFAKLIFEDNNLNPDMQVIFEILAYEMAEAEIRIQTSLQKYERKDIAAIMEEYRLMLSDTLAKLCRKKADILPPIKADRYE